MDLGFFGGTTPLLQAGRIVNINTTTHTYDVITDNDFQLKDLPIMFPYCSNEKGQGLIYVPEIGTRCLVCNTVNDEDFILGFLVASGTGKEGTRDDDQEDSNSYIGRSGNKSADLLPGDFEIGTASGNKIRILQGGIVEIIARDGLCLTKYISNPGENLIITRADIIENIIGAGSMVWKTDNDNKVGSLEFSMKSDLEKEDPDISIKMGSVSSGEGIEIVVGDLEDPTITLTLSQDGEAVLECKNLTVKSSEEITVEAKSVTLNATSLVKIAAKQIQLN